MHAARFNEVFQDTVDKSAAVLVKKAEEYADDVDRLRNFKKAGGLGKDSKTPREALAGMMAKHTISVYDLLEGADCPDLAVWDEKFIDHINYLILARALVVEELERKQ